MSDTNGKLQKLLQKLVKEIEKKRKIRILKRHNIRMKTPGYSKLSTTNIPKSNQNKNVDICFKRQARK